MENEIKDPELLALMEKNKKSVSSTTEITNNIDYLLLAKPACKALKRSETDLYINGLQIGDFYFQKKKINFGESVDVVPLAFLTMYAEYKKTGVNEMFVRNWFKEDVASLPLEDGSFYNRVLPNGNVCKPFHWVIVKLLNDKAEDSEMTVVSYKSTGSRVFKEWQKDAVNRDGSIATLVYTLHEQVQKNSAFEWTEIGFTYKENLVETDVAKAKECLIKSNKTLEDYDNCVFAKHNTIPQKVTAQITDDTSYDDADDAEVETF